jgi:diguanylate cyclase (GGDEF)-like protein
MSRLEWSSDRDKLLALGVSPSNRDELWSYCARYAGAGRFLGFFDIDNFRSLNQRYGRERGDQTLAEVWKRLEENTPAHAFVMRWSGNSFLFLGLRADDLPGFIRMHLAPKKFPEVGAVSKSAGLIKLSSSVEALDLKLAAVNADKALVRAKKGGGNMALEYVSAEQFIVHHRGEPTRPVYSALEAC